MIAPFLDYIQHEKRYSIHTLTSYRTDLEQYRDFILSEFSTEDLTQVNHGMIRSWIVSLSEKELVAKTLNRKIACLRSFYKYCLKRQLIARDPMLKVKSPKIKKSLPVFVEEKDMAQLLEQIEFTDDFEGTRDKLIMEILYGTGMRLSELIGLKEKDISRYDKTIRVLGKGNKERIIPVHDTLLQLMALYQQKKKDAGISNTCDNFIVTNEGEACYPMFVYRVVRKYLEAVTTIEKKSPHVLRHTFATHLLNKGADLNAIKDLLGHSSLAATQVYTHNSLDKLKSIFDQAHPKS